ncbi:hypothetical protein [Bosea sp. 117]|uniref:phage head-tail joining protein n=1 Tax=Bosea sp. 117 TaxID=1125973 RepID=UPI0004940925|nr:hypothetical protein [Bosea sp. 117]
MSDAATLTDQLDKLRAARASGLRRARFADREVEYRSDRELVAAIADLESRLAALSGRRPSTIRFSTSKGL